MTIELAVLTMCIISLIWNAINTYLIIKKNKTYEIEVEEIEDKLQPSAFEPLKIETKKEKVVTASGRRAHFQFSMVDIKPGAVLTSKINPEETAIVVDDKRIKFRGQITTTTAAAKIIMKECRPNRKDMDLTGPDYWMYNDTTLSQLRILKEKD